MVPSGATPAGATSGAPASNRKRATTAAETDAGGEGDSAAADAARPGTNQGSAKIAQINRGRSFTCLGFSLVGEKHQRRARGPRFCAVWAGLAYIWGVRVFGLTGGIGSGKSEVARRLRERGLPVVNADQLARLAVVPGSPGLARIVAEFGAEVLTASGELDRARLAQRVFSNSDARRALDAIVHPIVRELAATQFAALAEQSEPLACYEVPLLYEVGLEKTYTPVVVVSAPAALLRSRLATRDGLSAAQMDARIAAQMPLNEKVRRADYVIDNDGSLAELHARCDAVFDALCAFVGVPAARYPRDTLR